MVKDAFGLPKELGDGLVLRWATPDDVEDLAEFNFQQHNDSPDEEPEVWLKEWTRDLACGDHPTTGVSDFTIVVDESQQGRIVSSAVLISQTWSYDGIRFGCGRPELIATDESYRRRGLVREQMDLLHAKSEARGEFVQAITGIPWYYRQFGYEMTVNLGGSRLLPWSKVADLQAEQPEAFSMRPAVLDDIPELEKLYDRNCSPSLIQCIRDEATWRYEISNSRDKGFANKNRYIIESTSGQIAGYFEYVTFPKSVRIREIAVCDGISMREICWFAVRNLKEANNVKDNHPANPIEGITFALGSDHPAYEALDAELDKPQKPYTWYIRVSDLTKWLMHIRSVLSDRLKKSVMAGYDGDLRLNFYQKQLKLSFKDGMISEIVAFEPEHFFDSDAFFPGLTFYQLMFGHRSLDEIKHAYPDCFTEKNDAAVLLPILFPKKPSNIVMAG
jgi:hypothetical protein